MRTLRAFLWLRWRTLVNSLERRGARDVLERFSLAVDQLGPLMAAVIMLPSAVALAGLTAYAGWSAARGAGAAASLVSVRAVLLGLCVMAALGPFLLPSSDRTTAVRLLLLPVSRRLLFAAHVTSALADPWALLTAVAVGGLAAGLAAGGNATAALAAVAGGAVLIAALVGIGLTVTTTLHLVVRDRRRGEWLGVLLVVLLPVAAVLPVVLGDDGGRATLAIPSDPEAGGRQLHVLAALLAAVPSEQFTAVVTGAVSPARSGAPPLLTLMLTAALLQGLAFAAFVRLLQAGGGEVRGHVTGRARRRAWRVPVVSAATSAVAINQFRLVVRTPRGRSSMLSPLVLFGILALLAWQGGPQFDPEMFGVRKGPAVAAFAAFASLLAVLPFSVNQFAIDRAGLTRLLLLPIEPRAIVRGKTLGNALVAALPLVVTTGLAAAIAPTEHPAIWLSLVLSTLAAYALASPVATVLSALFPRSVDLNSMGQGSNAHTVATLSGMLVFIVAGVPPAAIAGVTGVLFQRPWTAPAALLAWLVVCAAVAALGAGPGARVLESRRENLALVAGRSPR